MAQCVVCGKRPDWKKVVRIFGKVFDRADRHGTASLTEAEQIAYHGQCCSRACYSRLK